MNQLSSFDENSSSVIFVDDDATEEEEKQQKVTQLNQPKSGLSELSKQLRLLQHANHSQAAQIDKLERKLQILSDLKGVSVKDLKSALAAACQGEAFNELRMEVETLKAQLDIARSNAPRSAPDSSAVANLELRVGELEEVEESLRSKLSSLYDSLRVQTTKATQWESLCAKREHQLLEYKQKYESLEEDLKREHDAVVRSLREELESKTNRVLEADSYLCREKERVSALIIQVAEYDAREIQLTREKVALQDLNTSLAQDNNESTAELKAEITAVEAKLQGMKDRALDAESKLLVAEGKIQALEEQTAGMITLEMLVANQQDELRQLMHKTGNLESERNIELEKLQGRTSAIQAKLQAEIAKSTELQREIARMKELEQSLGERDKELEKQRKLATKYKAKTEKAASAQSIASKEHKEMYERCVLELQHHRAKEEECSVALEKEKLTVQDLNKMCEALKGDIDNFKKQELILQKENTNAKTTIDRLQNELTENKMQVNIQEKEIESLQAQIQSTEEEAELRHKQFKTRFKVQDERIEDLVQQLASLVTAFNLERGERTEEHKTQTVLKESLVGADSEVAHQLHDIEEEKQNPPRSPDPSAAVASAAFVSPQRAASLLTPPRRVSYQPEPFDNHSEVGVAQGYLLKKEFAGWKKKYYYLHGNLTAGVFKLSFGDAPGRATKGFIDGIRTTISRVQSSYDFPKQPYCFVLRLNPHDHKSPTIYFAATSQEDHDLWMTALNMVTQGLASESTVSPTQQHYYPVGSRVVIVDLVHHPEYNGLSGTVTTPLKDQRQCVSIDSLQRKVKLSPANLELFALPDSVQPHRPTEFL
ncbi:hypothetical protein MHU86_4294 [Fragilaria crotonensis]|nr:hypothetical protein MHU86_4294 [Fragilaria crotonensis]